MPNPIPANRLPPETVAQVLYQAGWRGPDLVTMLAIGGRESGYNTNAHRTSSGNYSNDLGDFGLFQINYGHEQQLKQAGIISPNGNMFELLDPVKNARAALYLHQHSGFQPWAMGPKGPGSGPPTYNTNILAAQQAANTAQQNGLLGKPYQGVTIHNIPSGPVQGPTVYSLPGPVGTVVDAVTSAVTAPITVAEFLAKLTQPSTWVRVIKVMGGFVAIVGGVYMLGHDQINEGIRKGASLAKDAAVVA
jgi:hypothetical protein